MSTAERAPVVDLDPSRPAPTRIRPERAAGAWVPGEDHRVPDPVLGAAVRVPGVEGRLALPVPDAEQPRTALALTVWVRWGELIPGASEEPHESDDDPVATAVGEPPPLVALHLTRQRARRTRVEVVVGDERFGATVDLDGPAEHPASTGEALHPGDWHHLAVLWDGPTRTARLLVGSTVVAEHPTVVDHLPFRRTARVEVVKRRRGVRGLHVGPVRLHRELRAPAELTAQRHADLAAHPDVDESAPLAFRLCDAADEPTLAITDDDAPGRAAAVVLENRSSFPVDLPAADLPRARWLELRFRPGALAGDARHAVDPGSTRWRVEPLTRPDGGVSLLLAVTAPTILPPGGTIAVTLDHVRAAGDLGSHGTHLELCYPHPHHPGRSSARVGVARVVGRRGRRRSPLRFGVTGDPVVLNDGITPNTLRLYLANSSASRPVLLRAPVDGVGTALVLGLDAGGPDDSWALGTTDQLLDARVSTEPADWRVEVDTQDESPQWVLTPTRDRLLGPSERVGIVVARLLTDLPAGRTRVSLRLEDVPGYWDDERVLDVEKTRVHRDTAAAALKVHGAVHDRYGELLPPGTIVMWHGPAAEVPDGWLLCDGSHGTPDLVGRFVRGGAPEGPGTSRTGGSDRRTLRVEELPRHTHEASVDTAEHAHWVPMVSPETRAVVADMDHLRVREQRDAAHRATMAAVRGLGPQVAAALDAVHASGEVAFRQQVDAATLQVYVPRAGSEEQLAWSRTARVEATAVTSGTGGGEPVDVRPAYYELCFIMKRSPAAPGDGAS
ncbi:hypothetical protein [Pseudonocardia sp.]|uniref:hypothetical protein n=1 Tax=Pseudonocardia sp. TaxID=60912 RepID=UPI0026189304|nr:hypothetical protein [Pseudonocardia sp.]